MFVPLGFGVGGADLRVWVVELLWCVDNITLQSKSGKRSKEITKAALFRPAMSMSQGIISEAERSKYLTHSPKREPTTTGGIRRKYTPSSTAHLQNL